jgi:quercetin dioxygenase-like cupin family protein
MTGDDQLWFGDTLVRFRVSASDGSDGISVMESLAPRADSPPLHVHHDEDEVFHVLEGALTLTVDGTLVSLGAGETALAPQGVPHTYRVDSEQARWLVVTRNGSFEAFVRACSRPAERAELPERSGPPSAEQAGTLAQLAAAHGIDLVGAPLTARA